jgi:hypothetical protein
MSNLLERAIIDAKALKDAALKNAEQLVVEKYQLEVKEAMDNLLEAEDDLGMDDLFGDSPDDTTSEVPEPEMGEEPIAGLTSKDIESNMPNAFDTDEDQIIQIKLDSLEDDFEDEDDIGLFGGDDEYEADEIGIDIESDDDIDTITTPDMDMGSSVGIDVGSEMTPATLEEIISDTLKSVLSEEEEELDEEIDLDDLMEKVSVDFEPVKSGWAGTPEKIMQEYESMLLAKEQDSETKEENEELRKNVTALQKENRTLSSAALKLQEQNKDFNTAFKTMQEKLETMNVSNAKLLYINQALENASLNERQKRKIVEAISKAGTVQEAKIVFDTMSESVSTTSDVKRDTTLNEVVSRKSSLLVAARKEQTQKDANPLFNRMQTLAGIKTN